MKIETILIFVVSFAGMSAGPDSWDFENVEVNQQPADFYFDETGEAPEAKWQIVQQGDNKVLAQLDSLAQPARHSLAVVRDARFQEVRLEVKIKHQAEKQRPQAGVVWRYFNSENHLVACIDFEEGQIQLYRVVRGNRVQFGSGEKLSFKPGQWYTLRVEHRGNRIKVYMNDEAFIIRDDQYYREKGKVGLWTQTDSATFFDDFRAEELSPRK